MGIHAVLRFRPRRRLCLPQAAWCMSAALVTLHAPAAAQTVNWNGTTQDWSTGPNWSTGVVPSSTDDVSIDTRIFIPPFVTGPGATSQRLFVGGQFDVNTGLASTGTGMLTITNGGQLVNGAGNFFDTFIGVGTGSIGGLTVNGAGSNWTSTGAVLIGSSGATGSLTLDNGGTAGFGALFVGASLADFTGLTIINGSGPEHRNADCDRRQPTDQQLFCRCRGGCRRDRHNHGVRGRLDFEQRRRGIGRRARGLWHPQHP